jgi:hypothetical protein
MASGDGQALPVPLPGATMRSAPGAFEYGWVRRRLCGLHRWRTRSWSNRRRVGTALDSRLHGSQSPRRGTISAICARARLQREFAHSERKSDRAGLARPPASARAVSSLLVSGGCSAPAATRGGRRPLFCGGEPRSPGSTSSMMRDRVVLIDWSLDARADCGA